MKRQYLKLVQTFARELTNQSIPYNQMFLYGSAARGEEHEWSDIDVAVVGPSFAADSIEEMVRLRLIAQEIDPAISPVPLRPEDLRDMFSTIGQAVRKDGQRII